MQDYTIRSTGPFWPRLLACGLLSIHAVAALGQTRAQSSAQTTSVHWDKVPLRDALTRLATAFGEPILTDRRVDPNQRISLDVSDATSDEVLSRTAAAASLGASRLGGLVYFGPPAAAGQLRTLAARGDEQLDRLPANLRSALERKQSLDWPRLTEPRQLVTSLAQHRGVRIVGTERIPHDLWPAGSLPGLSFAEQLAVLLIAFDLTFAVDRQQGAIELVPIAGPVTISRRYRLPNVVKADQLKQQFPDLEIRVRGNDIVANGTVEGHERLRSLLQDRRKPERTPPVPAKTRKLYTLRIEHQPLQTVLEQLALRLGWTIETEEAAIRAAGVSLDQRVSFAVQNVDEDGLLRALLHPAGLDHQRDGSRVRIFPLGQRGE